MVVGILLASMIQNHKIALKWPNLFSKKYVIHPDILDRYDQMLADQEAECQSNPGTDLSHARWMISEMREMTDAEKAMRWLGFAQCLIILNGRTTVEAERNFTRPYFTKKII